MPGLLAALAFLFFIFAIAGADAQSPAAAAPTPTPIATASYARVHRAVSTNPSVQADFDDGLTLLYAFNPEEARRSFERATAADPTLAVAWWGIAMSHGVNINTSFSATEQQHGREAIARAVALETNAIPADHALIDAASRRFAATGAGDADRSARAFRDAMNAAAAAFPNDDDILTIAAEAEMDVHAWAYFTPDGKPGAGTAETIARLQTVLARTPGHIGANHLLIHMVEESAHPEIAVPSAERLAALSFEPAAEHLAHMPAHTFMRVGNYHGAGEANARALALYRVYLAGAPAGHADYFGHDCVFGTDAFMMSGEYARAREIATSCARGGAGMIPVVDLRFRMWDALAHDGVLGDFAGGMLLAHDVRLALAATRAKSARRGSDAVASISADVLDAAIARANGRSDAEIASLRDAVRIEDGFGYSEPPTFWYPVRESLGGAYLRAARYDDAERVFREDLTRDPENPRGLFGLAETLTHLGKPAEAEAMRKRYLQAWRFADRPLETNDL